MTDPLDRTTVDAPPLAGVLVVSCASTFPGQYCASLLARLGARVVAFEPPGGVSNRTYQVFNGGNESVVVDLKDAGDQAIVRDTARRADAFIESWRPGVADRLGVGPDHLRSINPNLVYCSLSGYGASSTLRDRAGHDINQVTVAGLPYPGAHGSCGEPFNVPLADVAGATAAALQIAAALVGVRSGGVGRFVDASLAGGVREWVDVMGGPEGVDHLGDILAGVPHYGVFLTSDGYGLSIGFTGEDKFWRNLCDAIGLSDLANVPLADRIARQAELRNSLTVRIASMTKDDLEVALRDVDTCWAFATDDPNAISGMIPAELRPVATLNQHRDSLLAENAVTATDAVTT